jgi:allophanate hydrolase subunit 1
MKEEANNPADSGLNEIMAARIEIAELNDAARQTQINDAIKALEGVIEFKIENGALHVSYDPMTTTEKKIEATVRSIGASIKAAATDTEAPHPDLPTQAAVRDTRVKGHPKDE